MVHPGGFAAKEPERPAVIVGAIGTAVTDAELEARSNQVAWLDRRGGLRPGAAGCAAIRCGTGRFSPDIPDITPTGFAPRATRVPMKVALYSIASIRCHIH